MYLSVKNGGSIHMEPQCCHKHLEVSICFPNNSSVYIGTISHDEDGWNVPYVYAGIPFPSSYFRSREEALSCLLSFISRLHCDTY